MTPPDRAFGKLPDMDAFLYFWKIRSIYVRNRKFPKLIQMGYPRLFSSWKKYILNKSPELTMREIKKMNLSPDLNLVTVILPSTVENLFDLNELEEWLRSVLRILRNKVPEDIILLKPHPMQKIEIVEKVLNEINDKNIKISYLHAGILSASSRFVISHHSTTIVDSMGLMVPTIHYQNLLNIGCKDIPMDHSVSRVKSTLGP